MLQAIDATADPLKINEFAHFLERQDRSPATVRTYAWGLDDLRDYLDSRGVCSLQQITRPALEDWQDRLLAAHLSPRSRSLATTAARQFFKWAGDHDYCDARLKDWLATVRVQPLKPKPIPPEELAKLLEHYGPPPAIETGRYDRPVSLQEQLEPLRNRAMFFVYLTTGLRVSEGLRLPRTGWERGMVKQKGGGDKLVAVPDYVLPIVREYLVARVDSSAFLFVSPRGRPMTPGGVQQVFQVVARKLGIAHFTPHRLRHTFATNMLAQGVDIRVVAELMGHKNLSSIMGYTEVAEPARQDAMRAFRKVVQPTIPEQTLAPDPRASTQNPTETKKVGRPRFRIFRDLIKVGAP